MRHGRALSALSRHRMGRAARRRCQACSKSSCSKGSSRACRGSRSCASARISAKPSTASMPNASCATRTPTRRGLLADEGIIRNRLKIDATIDNAKAYLKLRERQTLASFLWGLLDGRALAKRICRPQADPAANRRFVAPIESAEERRLSLCRPDDALCLHAIGRHGQRSSRRLPPVRAVRQAPKGLQGADGLITRQQVAATGTCRPMACLLLCMPDRGPRTLRPTNDPARAQETNGHGRCTRRHPRSRFRPLYRRPLLCGVSGRTRRRSDPHREARRRQRGSGASADRRGWRRRAVHADEPQQARPHPRSHEARWPRGRAPSRQDRRRRHRQSAAADAQRHEARLRELEGGQAGHHPDDGDGLWPGRTLFGSRRFRRRRPSHVGRVLPDRHRTNSIRSATKHPGSILARRCIAPSAPWRP